MDPPPHTLRKSINVTLTQRESLPFPSAFQVAEEGEVSTQKGEESKSAQRQERWGAQHDGTIRDKPCEDK